MNFHMEGDIVLYEVLYSVICSVIAGVILDVMYENCCIVLYRC